MAYARLFFVLLAVFVAASAMAGRPPRAFAQSDATAPADDGMRSVSTPDYTVHTDLSDAQLGDVLRRLAAMTSEYRQRTSAISNRNDDRKLPLYLFSSREDYERAGGQSDSVGFFDGERLLAYIGPKADARSWHVIQHEAFHQFLIAKLGYEVPIWLNEGLAEYFGESLYTGDGFVSGIVPQWRLRRLQRTIENARDDELSRLVSMTHEQWNDALRQDRYDLAWSLVHFLAHGDNETYQDGLMQYIRDSKKGGDPLRGFVRAIGSIDEIQARWRSYWLEYDPEEAQRTYARAAVQTVCSFTARAMADRRTIRGLQDLTQFAEGHGRPAAKIDLPPSLLSECLDWSQDIGHWTIDASPRAPFQVQLKMKDGIAVQAHATFRNGGIQGIESWIVTSEPSRARRRR